MVRAHQRLLFLFYQSKLYPLILWQRYLLCLHTASPLKGLAGFAEESLGPSGVAFEGRHRKSGGTFSASPAPLAGEPGWSHRPCRLKISAELLGRGMIEIFAWSCCNCPSRAPEISFVCEIEPLKSIAKIWPHARCTSAGLESNPEYPSYSWGSFYVFRWLGPVIQRYEGIISLLAASF